MSVSILGNYYLGLAFVCFLVIAVIEVVVVMVLIVVFPVYKANHISILITKTI